MGVPLSRTRLRTESMSDFEGTRSFERGGCLDKSGVMGVQFRNTGCHTWAGGG